MPIYEYGCGECGHEFEELVMAGESEPAECPSCGAEGIGRLVSNSSFHLKGSGWYVTDYKGDSKQPEAPDKTESTADAGDDSTSAEPDASTSTPTNSTTDSTTDDAA